MKRPQSDIQSQFGKRAPIFEGSASWITDPGLLAAHSEFLNAPAGELLDLCCGTGLVGAAFEGKAARRVGFDITDSMLERAKERLDEVHSGTAESLPFASGSFEVVVCRQALHFPDPGKALSEIFRVLKPGGRFIFSQRVPYGVADAEWMQRVNRAKQPLMKTFYTAESMRQLLQESGFSDLEMKERHVWELVNRWMDTPETDRERRESIARLYQSAPESARTVHPVEIGPDGLIRDRWRWALFQGFKKPY